MLSFLDEAGRSGDVVSIRSVSGVSSHRFGLEAELDVLDLSGRVVCVGFSNDQCWSCEATVTSTIFSCWVGFPRMIIVKQDSGCLGNISDGVVGPAYETVGVQVYAPMVSDGNRAVDGGTSSACHTRLSLFLSEARSRSSLSFDLLQRDK